MFNFIPIAYASVDTFIKKVNTYILNPIIYTLFIIAVAYFIYGILLYIKDGDSSDARQTGARHMMWGIFGMFIMAGVFFIMKLILGTLGISNSTINVDTGQVNIQ